MAGRSSLPDIEVSVVARENEKPHFQTVFASGLNKARTPGFRVVSAQFCCYLVDETA